MGTLKERLAKVSLAFTPDDWGPAQPVYERLLLLAGVEDDHLEPPLPGESWRTWHYRCIVPTHEEGCRCPSCEDLRSGKPCA
jgi:hypothetical protein